MFERFVPLATYLCPKMPESPAPLQVALPESAPNDVDETFAAARRFRAALADALDVALERLLEEIARSVLGRETQMAPAEIAAITAGALARYEGQGVLSLRVHPDDLDALEGFATERVADVGLHRGDVVLELRSGTIDLRLEARLTTAVAACLR